MDWNEVYFQLLKSFGEQGWWPLFPTKKEKRATAVSSQLSPAYFQGSPQNESQRFEIAVGAILTQNTNWKNASLALSGLYQGKLLHPKTLLETPQEVLESRIQSSGYFRQKARRLKIMAEFFLEYPHPKREILEIQQLSRILGNLHGIGLETRDSILLYAFEKPVFVVDAYTLRILDRLGLGQKKYHEAQEIFQKGILEKNTVQRIQIYKEFHALLVELGKNACKKKTPQCLTCPLSQRCKYPIKKAV